MLPWWGWLLLWVCLVLASAALLAWVGWRAWRSAKALSTELGRAERLLAALETERDRLAPGAGAEDVRLAVFENPASLAAEYVEERQARREAKRRRRAERLPGWARGVD